jgi:hypothetical protein
MSDRPASETPNPPQALEWLIANQLPDGSWGDPVFIMYYDRILSTLSALVALKTWGAAPAAIALGERFVRAHVERLALEAREMATIGFELVFPSLMETAEQLGLDLPYNYLHVKSVEAVRARKLARLPLEVSASLSQELGMRIRRSLRLNVFRLRPPVEGAKRP